MAADRCLHCGQEAGSLVCESDDCQRREAELQKARRMDARQKRINWNRESQLRALDRLVIPFEAARKLGTKRLLLSRMKALLRAIDSFAGEKSRCWASVPTLAEVIGQCERSTQLAIREAESLGLVKVTPRQNSTSFHDIQWSLVLDWSGDYATSGAIKLARGAFKAARGAFKTQNTLLSAPEPQLNRNEPPPPATQKPTARDICARGQNPQSNSNTASGFEAVVVAMRNLKPEPINGADSAVAEAKARGVTASELLGILRVAREKICELPGGTVIPAWGAGAIRNRVAKARPGESPTMLWPPPGEQYLKAVLTLKREQAAQDAARRNSEWQAHAATDQAADAARLTALESNHGEDLDQLSTVELQ